MMIADDAPFIRDILRQIVTKAGHTVIAEAENGEEAVSKALEKKPDLIVMDIVMPVKSGIQATKEILEENPKAKIIACSTVDQDIMLSKAMEAGAIDYICKPFKAADLLGLIEKVFKKPKGGKND